MTEALRWLPLLRQTPTLVYQVARGAIPTKRGAIFSFADQSFLELPLPAWLPVAEEVTPYTEVVE